MLAPRRALRSLPLLLIVAAAGCATHSRTDQSTPPAVPADNQTRLEVVNRSAFDMEVYLERGNTRTRMGLAPNGKTTRFSLGTAQVVGASSVRILAIPVGGAGRPAATEPTTLQPGQLVTLDVPPL